MNDIEEKRVQDIDNQFEYRDEQYEVEDWFWSMEQ
jgi:hypothetical protein